MFFVYNNCSMSERKFKNTLILFIYTCDFCAHHDWLKPFVSHLGPIESLNVFSFWPWNSLKSKQVINSILEISWVSAAVSTCFANSFDSPANCPDPLQTLGDVHQSGGQLFEPDHQNAAGRGRDQLVTKLPTFEQFEAKTVSKFGYKKKHNKKQWGFGSLFGCLFMPPPTINQQFSADTEVWYSNRRLAKCNKLAFLEEFSKNAFLSTTTFRKDGDELLKPTTRSTAHVCGCESSRYPGLAMADGSKLWYTKSHHL